MSTPDQDELAELSDDELLERIADYDPEEVPLADTARRALDADQESSGGS